MMVAEAGLEPAADEAYETSALPTELFRAVGITWLPLLDSNQGFRVQSPVPYQLGEGAIPWCHVRDLNPRFPI